MKIMRRKIKKRIVLSSLLVLALVSVLGYSHCQVPCGIYGDPMRIDLMAEHIETIEKSMNSIIELSGKEKPEEMNQLVRWINNKDLHAEKFNEIVTYYFMAQRIKPVESENEEGYEKYVEQLTTLHHMQVYAMKCKQTTDLENAEKLKKLLDKFEMLYFGKKVRKQEHSHEHGDDHSHGHEH